KPSVFLSFYRSSGRLDSIGSGKVVYNKDGTFEFRDVLPGPYRLTASIDVPGQPPMSAGLARQRIAYTPLAVGTSDVEGLVLILSSGASLSGRVRVEGRIDFASAVKSLALTH